MINISGGNGSTKEDAIIITAPDEGLGIAAEYDFISEIYGEQERDWRLVQQQLIHDDDAGKSYDIMIIEGKNIQYEIWFDITDFYGKFH